MAHLVKNLPAMQETWVRFLGWEDHLEKGKATHSTILAWRIARTGQSMGSQRVGHNWATFTHSLTHSLYKVQLYSMFISSPGCPEACIKACMMYLVLLYFFRYCTVRLKMFSYKLRKPVCSNENPVWPKINKILKINLIWFNKIKLKLRNIFFIFCVCFVLFVWAVL